MTTVALDAVYPSPSGFWSGGQVTTGSWQHTCTGTNLLLIVDVAIGASPDNGLGVNASYGGQSMTQVALLHPGGDNSGFQARFLLLNASVGRNTVTVNVTGGKASIAGASTSFNGADQSTGIAATTYDATGTSSTQTVAVSSNTSGNIILSAAVAGRSFKGPNSNGTKLFTRNGTTAYDGGGIQGASWAATGSSVTTSFTTSSSDDWSIISNEVLSATGTVYLTTPNLQLTAGSLGSQANIPQWMTWFYRAPNIYNASQPPLTPIQVTVANTAGQWMFALVSWRQDAGIPGVLQFPSTVNVSDDAGNFWIPVESGQPNTGIVRCSIWMAPAARAATTVTFSPASTTAGDAFQSALWAMVFETAGDSPWYSVEETDFAYVNQGTSLTVSQKTPTTSLFTVGIVASDNPYRMPVNVSSGLSWASLTTFPITNFVDNTGDIQQWGFIATTGGSDLSLSISRSSGNAVADLAGVMITVHGVSDATAFPYPMPIENWPVLVTEIAVGPVINANPVMLSGTADWSVNAPPARDQVSGLLSAVDGGAVTWSVNPTPGSKVLVAAWSASSETISSVADNGLVSSAFTLDATLAGGSNTVWIYRADNITLPTSGSYTVTITGSGGNHVVAGGQSYLGVKAGGPTATHTGSGTSTSVSTGNVTPAAVNALYFAAFADATALSSETITLTGTGFIQQFVETNGSASVAGAVADKFDSAAPTATACTWTLGDSVAWVAAIAVYDANPAYAGTLQSATWPVFQAYPNYQALITPSLAVIPSGQSAVLQLVSEPELIKAPLDYAVNAWVFCPGNNGEFLTLQPQIVWYDNTKVNVVETDAGIPVQPGAGEWENLVFPSSVSPPGNAVYAAAAIAVATTLTVLPSSSVVYVGYCGVGSASAYENTSPDQLSWSDVSTRNVAQDTISISRGIQYEQQALEAGTAKIVLSNPDGQMMFGNMLSSYWPNIGDTDVPIRLRAIWPLSQTPFYVLFSGFTDQITFHWDAGDPWFGYAEVEASDAWSRLTTQMLEPYVEEISVDNPVVFITANNSGANSALGNITPAVSQPSNFGAGSAVASFTGNQLALPGASSLANWQVTGVGTLAVSANQGIALTYFPANGQPLPPVAGGVSATWWMSSQNVNAGGTINSTPANPPSNLTICTAWSGAGPAWSLFMDYTGFAGLNTTVHIAVYDQTTGAATVTNTGGDAQFFFGTNQTIETYFAVAFTQTSLTLYQFTVGSFFPFVTTVPCNLAPNLIGFSLGGNAGPLYATAGTSTTVGFWNAAFGDFTVFQGILPPARVATHLSAALAVGESGLTEAQGELDVYRLARILGYAGATPVILQEAGWNLPVPVAADEDMVTPLTDTNGQVTSSYFTNIASSTLAFMFVNGPGVLIYRRRLQQYDRAIGQWVAGDSPGINLVSNDLSQGPSLAPWAAPFNGITFVPASVPGLAGFFPFCALMQNPTGSANPTAFYGVLGSYQGVAGIIPGATYQLSAQFYVPQGWAAGVSCYFTFYNSSFVGISTYGSPQTPAAAGSLTFTQTQYVRAPFNAAYAFLALYGVGSPPANIQFYIADVQFTQVPAVTSGGGQAGGFGGLAPVVGATPNNAAPEVPYLTGAELSSDRALLYNQAILNQFGTNTNTVFQGSGVQFQPTSGVLVTIQNTPSVIARAGVPYTATLYLNNTAQALPYYLNDGSLEDFGNWITQTLAAPLLRPEKVTITPAATPQAVLMALQAEIGDTVTFRRRPIGAAEIQILTYLSKLTHTISIKAGQWDVDYELSPFPQGVVLACDDVIHGPPTGGNVLGW